MTLTKAWMGSPRRFPKRESRPNLGILWISASLRWMHGTEVSLAFHIGKGTRHSDCERRPPIGLF